LTEEKLGVATVPEISLRKTVEKVTQEGAKLLNFALLNNRGASL
jgi:hypothetical protein